jgi:hypothetical protein
LHDARRLRCCSLRVNRDQRSLLISGVSRRGVPWCGIRGCAVRSGCRVGTWIRRWVNRHGAWRAEVVGIGLVFVVFLPVFCVVLIPREGAPALEETRTIPIVVVFFTIEIGGVGSCGLYGRVGDG